VRCVTVRQIQVCLTELYHKRICYSILKKQKSLRNHCIHDSIGRWFSGNYGYNSRQQFGECTPHVNSVPPGVLLYPSTNFCTPSDKSVPQEVPGIPELSVR